MSRTRSAGLAACVLAVLAAIGLLIFRATLDPERDTVSTVLQGVAVGVLVPSVTVCAIALFRRGLRRRSVALRPEPELVLDVVRSASLAALVGDRGSVGRVPVFLEVVVTVGGLEVWGGARFRRVLQFPWTQLRSIAIGSAAEGGQTYRGLHLTLADGSACTVIVTGGGLTGLSALEGPRLNALVDDLERIRHDRML